MAATTKGSLVRTETVSTFELSMTRAQLELFVSALTNVSNEAQTFGDKHDVMEIKVSVQHEHYEENAGVSPIHDSVVVTADVRSSIESKAAN